MRKILLLTVLAIMAAGCGGGGEEDGGNGGDKGIVVGESGERLFPDPVFNKYCLQFDTDGDGVLTTAEKEVVTVITIRDAASVEGLDQFPNLKELAVSGEGITEIDVSKNLELKSLIIDNTKILELDVSKNAELTILYCEETNISDLDIASNSELMAIYISKNNLSNNALRKIVEDLPAREIIDPLGAADNGAHISFNTNQNGQTDNPFALNEIHNITSPKGWGYNGR